MLCLCLDHLQSVMERVNNHKRRCDMKEELCKFLFGMQIENLDFREQCTQTYHEKELEHLRNDNRNIQIYPSFDI